MSLTTSDTAALPVFPPDKQNVRQGGIVNTVLKIQSARYRYGDKLALDGVDLTINKGECVALLGPNGAGKTTLVNLAVGLLARQAGTIRVAGGHPRNAATLRRLGVVQ